MPATYIPHGDKTPWFEDAVILLTLVAFTVAQTVYEILASNPEFLGARRVTNSQLLAVVAVFGILPAIVIGALWALSRRFGGALHRTVFSMLVAFFSLALLWQARNTYLGDGEGLLHSPALWVLPSLALAWLAWRNERGFRSLLLALSPAILIFPALFLYRTWRAPVAPPAVIVSAEASTDPLPPPTPNGTPVFVMVFDELGLHVLLNEEGQIDAEHYPNFARLASESHWFRNATSNSAKTITSLATIVTGNMPRSADSNHSTYPNTIFSFLAPPYEVFIEEVGNTHFCDSEAFHCLNDATGDATAGLLRDLGYLLAERVLPAKLDFGLPDTSHTWGPFQSAEDWTRAALARARRVLHSLDALPRQDVLFFAHMILPHSPYTLTPDGEIYAIGPYALDEGQDAAILASLTERYRMQVRYLDRWLGQFLDRMKQRGLYGPSLLIVTGDHGVSWKSEAPGRTLREENAELMLTVPLFIKRPFQTQGEYSERDVQHIDLAPTIAQVLDTTLPFPVAGRSAFSPEAGPRPKVAFGDAMARFEFNGALGLKPVESHVRRSSLVGQRIDSFTAAANDSVRGTIESIQLAPPETPEFAAGLAIMVSGWALEVDPDYSAIESRPAAARGGKRGLVYRGLDGGAKQFVAGLVPGGRYRASAWVRSKTGGRGQVSLRIAKLDGEIVQSALMVPGQDFSRLEFDFLAPPGPADDPGKTTVRLDLHAQDAGVVHWDDAAVIGIAAQPAGEGPGGDPYPNQLVNSGFEDPLQPPWEPYGREPAPDELAQPFEVAIALNGEIVGATRPGAERWDVATRLQSPMHRYLRCGWSVSIAAEALQEGENTLDAYAILDPGRRVAVRLTPREPWVLLKNGASIQRRDP